MYYNPYETKQAKKRRITSNIALTVLVLAMVTAIIALVFRDTSVTPYQFKTVTVSNDMLLELDSQSNELRELLDYTKGNDIIKLDNLFEERFPVSSAMLKMDTDVYDEEKPLIYVKDNYIAVAQTMVAENNGYRLLEVILLQLERSINGNVAEISLKNIAPFTVVYNTRDSSVAYRAYSPGGFHLSLFQMTFYVGFENLEKSSYVTRINERLSIKDATEKKQLHHTVIDIINGSYHSPEISVYDSYTEIICNSEKADYKKNTDVFAYKLLFDDYIFRRLDKFTMKFEYSSIDKFDYYITLN